MKTLNDIIETANKNGVEIEINNNSIKAIKGAGISYSISIDFLDELPEHHDWSTANWHQRRYGNPLNNRNIRINESKREAIDRLIEWINK